MFLFKQGHCTTRTTYLIKTIAKGSFDPNLTLLANIHLTSNLAYHLAPAIWFMTIVSSWRIGITFLFKREHFTIRTAYLTKTIYCLGSFEQNLTSLANIHLKSSITIFHQTHNPRSYQLLMMVEYSFLMGDGITLFFKRVHCITRTTYLRKTIARAALSWINPSLAHRMNNYPFFVEYYPILQSSLLRSLTR